MTLNKPQSNKVTVKQTCATCTNLNIKVTPDGSQPVSAEFFPSPLNRRFLIYQYLNCSTDTIDLSNLSVLSSPYQFYDIGSLQGGSTVIAPNGSFRVAVSVSTPTPIETSIFNTLVIFERNGSELTQISCGLTTN